ncbi:MAG: carboxypeptidase regulatory-like domain-containing protein [Bryobacterales bacterium]|nr:carboxypeptidase regulatory-like domain-containing protein [Bryobacterales bacterium]
MTHFSNLPRRAPALCLALSILTSFSHAQTITASLEGIVSDPTAAVIVGAKVRVVSAATNAVTALETDTNGRFLAPSLPPGSYQVIVEASGFKKAERTGIALQVNQAARLEIQLELGAATETVSVNSTAPLLEASSAALGQVVSNQSIVNLPLNQRNPFALVFLVPGVVGNVGFNFNNANISINGGRPGSNEILADGIPSAPPLVNPIQGYSVFPSVDAVQEFKVQTNSYSAEFGRSGGGVINLVFKSGTNQLHGSVFEFLRNSKLDANDFFANSRGVPLPSFKRNQFGASAGGPVYLGKWYDGRNRTFFHFTYEGLRQGQLQNQLTTVPTSLQWAGDFSQTRNAAAQQVVIYDPATTTPSGTAFLRQPFPGNIMPAGRMDPVGAAVARFYPLPNGAGDANSGTNNFAASGKSVVNINQFDVKGDEILNDYHRLFFRYSRRRLSPAPPDYFPSDILIAQGGSFQPQHYNNAAFDYTWSAAPTTLLNFRYGLGRTAFFYRPRSDGFDPTQLGFPAYIAANSDRIMFPGFASQGYVNLGNGGAGDFSNAAFETHIAGASATKVLTSHTLKFGYEARMLRVNTLQAGASTGNYSFTRAFTQGPNPNQASAIAGDGVASLLTGLGTGAFTQKFKDVATTSSYHGMYFADDYKVTRRLTLNLGLRYELQVPRTERYNRLNVFNPFVTSPLAGPSGLAALTGGLQFAALEGRSRRQYETERTNLAPRFGFAYELNRATVLRGGYGLFFAPSLRSAAGTVSNTGYRSDSSYLAALDGVTPTTYLRNPFPNGFTPVSGSSLGLLTGIGSPLNAELLGDNTVPYSQNWNLNIQRQLPGNLLVEAAYVGSRGLHLNQSGEGDYNLNQLTPDTLALGTQLQQQLRNPFLGLITTGPLATANVPRSVLLRPYPQYVSVTGQYLTGASSVYHSFQMKVERRFAQGFSILASLTAAKLIDDHAMISNVGRDSNMQNIYNRAAERGVSPQDVSRALVVSSVYELPIGRGRRIGANWNRLTDALLGRWQINGILTLQTGQPLTITTQNTSNAGGSVLRPNNNGSSAKLDGPIRQRLNRYFNTAVFSQPAPFTFGNTGRTLPDVRAQGSRNLDFSLFKEFAVTERVRMQFRAESFNFANFVQFGFPNQVLSSGQIGVISATANSPRQIQFGLKLLF